MMISRIISQDNDDDDDNNKNDITTTTQDLWYILSRVLCTHKHLYKHISRVLGQNGYLKHDI